jgi:hypothetical protein
VGFDSLHRSQIKTHNDMKTFLTLVATAVAVIVQTCVLGLNGLTLITIPMTIFLGLELADKLLTNNEKNQTI